MYKQITSPESDPVTIAELKSDLRITHSNQDTMLTSLIAAATKIAENYLRYQLMTCTWEMYLDAFPDTGKCIWIQKVPVTAVSSIKYYNDAGVLTTWTPATEYVVDLDDKPCRIFEAVGYSWPSTQARLKAVTIAFTCGYATSADVPEPIKQGILKQAATLFENPQDEVTGTQVNKLDQTSLSLWRPYRAMRY